MSETKSVALTNVNCENLSRQELLSFINSKIGENSKLLKVENLSTGAAYCQIMEMHFPNSIGWNRIKTEAKLEHEIIHNWRLLQAAFTKLKYNKTVPIDRLIKGRFQDNFEFLQWFKKFYDSVHDKENHALNMLDKLPKANKKPSPKTQNGKADHLNAINENFIELKHQIETITDERNYYLNKTVSIGAFIKEEMQKLEQQEVDCKKDINFCESVLKILNSPESDRIEAEPTNKISA